MLILFYYYVIVLLFIILFIYLLLLYIILLLVYYYFIIFLFYYFYYYFYYYFIILLLLLFYYLFGIIFIQWITWIWPYSSRRALAIARDVGPYPTVVHLSHLSGLQPSQATQMKQFANIVCWLSKPSDFGAQCFCRRFGLAKCFWEQPFWMFPHCFWSPESVCLRLRSCLYNPYIS